MELYKILPILACSIVILALAVDLYTVTVYRQRKGLDSIPEAGVYFMALLGLSVVAIPASIIYCLNHGQNVIDYFIGREHTSIRGFVAFIIMVLLIFCMLAMMSKLQEIYDYQLWPCLVSMMTSLITIPLAIMLIPGDANPIIYNTLIITSVAIALISLLTLGYRFFENRWRKNRSLENK